MNSKEPPFIIWFGRNHLVARPARFIAGRSGFHRSRSRRIPSTFRCISSVCRAIFA